jgi:hypothetical protein
MVQICLMCKRVNLWTVLYIISKILSVSSCTGIFLEFFYFLGLPNVGKSTFFNVLTKTSLAAAENFPFCTIDPNESRYRILVPVSVGSVVDQDPRGSAFRSAGAWSGSRREKKTRKKEKKWRNFMFWSTECSILRAGGFSCSMDALHIEG